METNMINLMEFIPVIAITILILSWAITYLMLQGRAKSIKELNETIDGLAGKVDLSVKDQQEVQSKADRFESLSEERQNLIDHLNGDLSKLRLRIDEEAQQKSDLSNIVTRLETEMKSSQAAADEKIELLSNLREEMEKKFQEMAQDALKTQGETFSKTNIEKLEATLNPLREHVTKFEIELKEVNKETIKDRERLKTEINQLTRRSEEISQEAVALTRALKGDHQKQGAWGEMILEGILQRSGLREGEEYETQAHREGEDGERLRPDVVVNMPGKKTLIIDSKVSLIAYSEAVEAEDETEVIKARKRHTASLRAHINGLSAKQYQNAEGSSVDYVIMFVPIEGALSEALREDGTLTEYALERHITIATPTTLMMALRTVSHVWAVERRNQNAEKIAERAGRLYDKVAGFVTNMENVGKRITQADAAYQTAFGQLSRGQGNLLSQVETLKELGAKASKSIAADFDTVPEVQKLETEPGQLTTEQSNK